MLELTETSKSDTGKVLTLQPMGFTDILDAMFSLYRTHFRLFVGIATIYIFAELVNTCYWIFRGLSLNVCFER